MQRTGYRSNSFTEPIRSLSEGRSTVILELLYGITPSPIPSTDLRQRPSVKDSSVGKKETLAGL